MLNVRCICALRSVKLDRVLALPLRCFVWRRKLWPFVDIRLRHLLAIPVTLGLFAIYYRTAAPGLTWANLGADSGDFLAAIATWGPHPTGYPTYILLGRLLITLPFGDWPHLLTLLSAFSMAVSCGALVILTAKGVCGPRRVADAAGLISGLALGLGTLSWSQATVVEVHGLNALFVTLALTLTSRMRNGSRSGTWTAVGLSLLSGLALGNHLIFALMLPVVAAALWRSRRGKSRKWVVICSVAFSLGLTVYLYLPLSARTHPPINWGDPSTWQGFFWVISGGPYRGLVFQYPLADIPARIASWSRLLLDQFGIFGVALGLSGALFGRPKSRWINRSALWMVLAYSALALCFNSPDSSVYLIPAFVGFAWWIGLGLAVIINRLGKINPRLALPAVMVTLALLGVRLPNVWAHVDARTDMRAVRYAQTVMREAPQDAFIISYGDRDSFPLWFAQYGMGQRPDLKLVVSSLTQFEWYRRSLGSTYSSLSLPEYEQQGTRLWVEALLVHNPGPICRVEESRNGFRLECED